MLSLNSMSISTSVGSGPKATDLCDYLINQQELRVHSLKFLCAKIVVISLTLTSYSLYDFGITPTLCSKHSLKSIFAGASIPLRTLAQLPPKTGLGDGIFSVGSRGRAPAAVGVLRQSPHESGKCVTMSFNLHAEMSVTV